MTSLELHRQHPELELAPILRVIKYLGFDSNALAPDEVERVLQLYGDFESDPELVVGTEAVAREAGVEVEEIEGMLARHHGVIPYLGTPSRPMVPTVGIAMIRAAADGGDPAQPGAEILLTLTQISKKTGISVSSLSKYVRDNPNRVPSRQVGKTRRFPIEAIAVFEQIKSENMGRRSRSRRESSRQKATVSRRYAGKFAALEEEVSAALNMAKELSRSLNGLSRKLRKARQMAESAATPADGEAQRPRRSGGKRPNTIVAACKEVLLATDEPMRVADITRRVVAMGTPIRAKNPNVTVSSILSSYDDFIRVRRGFYRIAPGTEPAREETSVEAQVEAEVEPAAELVTREAGDVLADLRAAAAEQERAEDGEDLPRMDMAPFGATG